MPGTLHTPDVAAGDTALLDGTVAAVREAARPCASASARWSATGPATS